MTRTLACLSLVLAALLSGCTSNPGTPAERYPWHGPIMIDTNRVEAPQW